MTFSHLSCGPAMAEILGLFLIIGGTVTFIVHEFKAQKRREKYFSFDARVGRDCYQDNYRRWTK